MDEPATLTDSAPAGEPADRPVRSWRRRLGRGVVRRFGYVLVASVALLAVLTLATRWQLGHALQLVDGRLPILEQRLPGSRIVAAATSFGIRGFAPYVRIDGLDLRTAEGLRLQARSAAVELDTFETLLRLTPILQRLQIADAQLTLRQSAPGEWALPRSRDAKPWTRADTDRLSDLLWESDRIAIDSLVATLLPYGQPAVRVVLDAQLANRQGDHRARVRLLCGGTCAGELDYALDGNPLLGVRNGNAVLALRGVPQVRGVARVGPLLVDLLDNRVLARATVRDGASVVRGDALLGAAISNGATALPIRARGALQGGGEDLLALVFPSMRLALGDRVVSLAGLRVAEHDEGWRLQVPDVQIAALLTPVVRAGVLPAKATEWLAALAPRAEVTGLRAQFGERFSYAALLRGLVLEPYKGVPEIRGADVTVQGHARGGRLVLGSRRFRVGFPELYTRPFSNVALAGPIDFWFDRGLRLHSGMLAGDAENVRLAGRFSLDRPDDRSMQAFALLLDVRDTSTRTITRFLPYILDPPLKRWLDSAIGDGELRAARVALHSYGNPQTGPRSLVEVGVDVRDMALTFQPDWPTVQALDGRILVTNRHVFADVTRARAGAIEVGAGRVTVLPHDRHVGLDLAAQTGTQGLIDFLRASPVRARLPWLAEWNGDGELELRLVGNVSLDDDAHDFTVDAQHARTRLTNTRLAIALDGLAGDVRYRYPASVESPVLAGTLNGEAVRFGITSDDSAIALAATGRGDGRWLEHWLPWPMAKATTGAFAWRADLRIGTATTGALRAGETTIALTTDLVGLGLSLPAPLDKAAATRRPVRFGLRSDGAVVQLGYDDSVLAFRGELIGGNLRRGAIGIGRAAPPLQAAGLDVQGSPVDLDVLAWGALLAAGDGGVGLPVRALLNASRVRVGDLSLPDGSLDVRSTADRYRVDFDQRDFAGSLEVFRDARPMHLRLQRARLPGPSTADRPSSRGFVAAQDTADEPDSLSDWRIKEFPSMSVEVGALYYGDELLGRVSFDLQPVADGIELRDVSGELRALAFDDARLSWRRDGRGDHTRFLGGLTTDNVAPVLASFGYAPSVESERMNLRADLGWDGSPLAFRLRDLDGTANVALRSGRFVQVEGAGAARVLGIFDFASIARRARLDFADVFGKGLSFDTLEGRLQFTDGVLGFPESLRVVGTGSEFRLGGRVDLATGALSNDMIVTLPLSRTLPWYAAYAAFTANPLAGAGVLVAERLFRDRLNAMSSAKYHVSGTIDEPLVSFVSVFDRTIDQSMPARAASDAPARANDGQATPASAPRRTGAHRAPSTTEAAVAATTTGEIDLE